LRLCDFKKNTLSKEYFSFERKGANEIKNNLFLRRKDFICDKIDTGYLKIRSYLTFRFILITKDTKVLTT